MKKRVVKQEVISPREHWQAWHKFKQNTRITETLFYPFRIAFDKLK